MVMLTEPPGCRVPLAGEKLTPLRLLLADQLALPIELAVSANVTVHCGLLVPPVQLALLVLRLVGVTVKVGGGVFDLQVHETLTGVSPSAPAKVRLPVTPTKLQGSRLTVIETL
jgi:hypothetical protein